MCLSFSWQHRVCLPRKKFWTSSHLLADKEQIGIGKQSKGHGSDKDPTLHLGPKLLESAWKPTDAMKKKKDK